MTQAVKIVVLDLIFEVGAALKRDILKTKKLSTQKHYFYYYFKNSFLECEESISELNFSSKTI